MISILAPFGERNSLSLSELLLHRVQVGGASSPPPPHLLLPVRAMIAALPAPLPLVPPEED